MNNENLRNFKDCTESEQREKAAAGGRASGKKRRERKLLRECLEIILDQKVEVIKDGKKKKITGAEALSARLYQSALKGDVRAFEVLRDTVGQKPVEKIVMADVSDDVIHDVEEMVYGEKL